MTTRTARRHALTSTVLALLTAATVGSLAGPAAADPTPTATPTASTTAAPTPTGAPSAPATSATPDPAAAAAAARAAQIAAQISQVAAQITTLNSRAAVADQNYAAALPQLDTARAAAQSAAGRADTARANAARTRTVANAQAVAMYQNAPGSVQTATALVTSPNPQQVLDTMSMTGFVTARATELADTAAAAKTAADDAQIAADAARDAAQQRLAAMKADADTAHTAVAQAVALKTALMTQLPAAQRAAAEVDLAAALGGWASTGPDADLQTQWAATAAADKAAASAPATGTWSSAVGKAAALRALAQLGLPYAFAGGNAAGPTLGRCLPGDAANDCHVVGFDCSGLALFAWAPYGTYDHYAANQYRQVGKLHPSPAELLPGDLVFWSSNGTAAGIHHVAIYVGAGIVVQAPHSGDIVRVTPLARMGSEYFGATRPLT